MESLPWKTESSKNIFKNPWLSLREDNVINDRGEKLSYAVVDLAHGVTVLAIDPDNTVYLVKQYRYPLEDYTIEATGGRIDNGEAPIEAAKRELYEEVNIKASELISLGIFSGLSGNIAHIEHLFLAKLPEVPSLVTPQLDEGISLVTVPMEQAIEWALDSTIIHGPALAVILRAKEYLKF